MSPRKRVKKSARKSPAKSVAGSIALAYDLGGTKVAVGAVDRRGNILTMVREPVITAEGPLRLVLQLADLGKAILKKYPAIRRAGLASAGPLDPRAGVLLDPTNMITHGQGWGKVPIIKMLTRKLGLPVGLENDAAAAVLAEAWIGAATRVKNSMILTLGTGLGTGMIANGELVRSGRWLHPEGGHIFLNYGDTSAPCGCGNFGCAEAYLSGRNFGFRAHKVFGVPTSDSAEVAALARSGDPRALKAFENYAEMMAAAITSYVVLYSPEVIILGGSFAKASDLFLARAQEKLAPLLVRRRVGVDLFPRIVISPLEESGLIGAATIAFRDATR